MLGSKVNSQMKLSDITFQELTIYDKTARNVIAETAQNLSVVKEAEICYLGGYICLKCPECEKMLGLRNEYSTGETVKCHRCQIKLYISAYKRYER